MFDPDFDSQKLMYHPVALGEWLQKDVSAGPVYTEFELSSRCNCKCIFCGVDHQVNHRCDSMDAGAAEKILAGLAEIGNRSVMFCGHGEPLLNPEAVEIINYAASLMSVSVTTNGAALDERKLPLIDHLEWIRFSVNGGSPENYAHVHGTDGGTFDTVMANITAAVARKRKLHLPVTIGTQLVLLPENCDEVIDLAKRFRDTGVDYFSIKPYSQHPFSHNRFEIDYSKYLDLEEKLAAFSSGNYRIIFRKSSMVKAGGAKSYRKCHGTNFISFISANGDVWECNVFAGDRRFYTGNGREEEMVEIWNGERRRKVLDFIDNGLDLDECRDLCRMEACNRYLWRLKNPLAHDNFI